MSLDDLRQARRSRAREKRLAAVAGIFDDISDVASSVVSTFTDVGTSAIDAVPGGRDVREAVDSAVTGPVRDFANTGVGRFFLTAVASSVTGGLAPLLGPQLATLAFAIPGMAAGDDFVTAWTQEFASRVKQTADILGADYAGPWIDQQLGKLNAYLQQYNVDLSKYTSDTFQQLAKAAGVADITAAYAVGLAIRQLPSDWGYFFDPRDGHATRVARQTVTDVSRFPSLTQLRQQASIQNVASTSFAPGGGASQYSLSASRAAAPVATVAPAAVRATAPTTAATTTNRVVLVLGLLAVGGAGYFLFKRKRW